MQDMIVDELNKKTLYKTKKINMSKYDIVIWCILFSLLLSILRDILPGNINILLGGILIVSLAIIISSQKSTISILFVVFMILAFHVFSANDYSLEIKDCMNWLVALEMLIACSNHSLVEQFSEKIINYRRTIRTVLYIYNAEIILMLLLPWTYSYAWGSRIFNAFNAVQGTAANCCLGITIATFYLSIEKRFVKNLKQLIKNNLFIILGVLINVYAILETQVRVILFPVLAIYFIILNLFFEQKVKRQFISVIGIVLGIFVMLRNSAFISKMAYSRVLFSFDGFSFADAYLSSRPIIWKRLITNFMNENSSFHHLVGAGFSRVYEINMKYGGVDINAHSDLVHTFVGLGYIGLAIMLFYSFKVLGIRARNEKMSVLLILFFFIPEFINGVMMTPNHVYALLFMILTIREINHNKQFNNDYNTLVMRK